MRPALPGFGESHNVKSLDSINKMAKEIINVLDQKKIDKFNLIGHSMGGMIVQEITKLIGDRVNKLICFATGSIGDIPGRFETMDETREKLKKEGLKPRLNLSYNFLADGFDFSSDKSEGSNFQSIFTENYKWGVEFFRSLFYGSYKAPREIIWIIGIIIYLLMMAAAFMGYVLPWGQMSFWGATVITNLFSAIPLVGEGIVTWLWGGYSVDNPTLTRFFTLHYLIPFLILGLVVLHIWALHVPGNNNPVGIDIKKPSKDTVPFHPYIVIKDGFALLMFMIVFAFFVFYAPNILGHADNYIEANPMVTPAHIVPEWYLLPFYAILRSVPDKLLGVVAMLSAILILAVLPWLDTSKIRSAVFRPLYKQFYWILVADVLILGYVGAMPAEGLYLLIARVATAYYFLHFLEVLRMQNIWHLA